MLSFRDVYPVLDDAPRPPAASRAAGPSPSSVCRRRLRLPNAQVTLQDPLRTVERLRVSMMPSVPTLGVERGGLGEPGDRRLDGDQIEPVERLHDVAMAPRARARR